MVSKQRKRCETQSLNVQFMNLFLTADLFSVGEEDEVSIKEAIDMIAKALDFKGNIHVSFQHSLIILHPVPMDQFIILTCLCRYGFNSEMLL